VKSRYFINNVFWVALGCLLLPACSDSLEGVSEPTQLTRISGTVVESISGVPIRDANVSTDPPTEEVSTGGDGSFTLIDTNNGGGRFQVLVDHIAYDRAQALVNVGTNTTARVDFSLQQKDIGLHVSTNTITFNPQQNRKTFRLSSNVLQTGYFILASEPWLRVSPSEGVIANRESIFVDVYVDRSLIPSSLPIDGSLIVNSDNGTQGLVLSVSVQENELNITVPESDATPDSILHQRQNDCRQTDVLRFGFDDPTLPLIQFPPSLELPERVGRRTIQFINPFLIDSFVLSELGTVVIAHAAGGLEDTSLEIFEIDKQDKIVSLAVNNGVDMQNRRARLEWGLTPGVYCYYLGGTTANFSGENTITVDYGFEEAQ